MRSTDDLALSRQVVLKVLPGELAAVVNVERFNRETLLLARLQHPHIVPVLNVGSLHGLPWFSMPYTAGAEVIMGDSVLPTSFAKSASRVSTYAYMQDGTDRFLATFGPAAYHSSAEYLKTVRAPLFASSIGTEDNFRKMGTVRIEQRVFDSDPDVERTYHAPRRAMLAEYVATLDRLTLDGYVYPAIQMPPVDETMPQDGRVSEGPHSATSWVNMIGVPAVVVSAGYYASGLPFGLEFSSRPWADGNLLGIAYAWERVTPARKPPVLVETGLLSVMRARAGR